MKILFIIQGEGRGHLTQAISLKQLLESEGHEVVEILVGKSKNRELPAFFKEKILAPVSVFESPNFLPSAKNKQVNILKSTLYNLLRLSTFFESGMFIRKKIKSTGADLVVNFYELLTGLTYFFIRPKTPMVAIAHQYLFLHPDFKFPPLNPTALFSLKLFTRLTALGARKRLALSFRKMREIPEKSIVVVPPLLRKEVLQLVPEENDFLLGYILNSGFSEEIIGWQERHRECSLHIFWDKKGAPAQLDINDKLSFHQLDDVLFLKLMAQSRAYATTAGFESVCEALFLNKPVLMVPTHIEQACNAFDALQSGNGTTADCFNLDSLLEISKTKSSNDVFRYWARQADWLILREFRSDLLHPAYNVPSHKKGATISILKTLSLRLRNG